LHDIDNLSDHDPIQLELGLDLQYIGFSANIYTPRALWEKASDLDLFNYKTAVSKNLADLRLQPDVFACHNMNCIDNRHFQALTDYVQYKVLQKHV